MQGEALKRLALVHMIRFDATCLEVSTSRFLGQD
jgi:hypothetical protein